MAAWNPLLKQAKDLGWMNFQNRILPFNLKHQDQQKS
jgi:hypothetical protein